MESVIAKPQLDKDEARTLVDEVKGDVQKLWNNLLTLYEGGAHIALEYDSWGEFFEEEFGQSRRQGYHLIDAARVVRAIEDSSARSCTEQKPNLEQTRALAPLVKKAPEIAQQVWAEMVDEHGEKVTATKVKQSVAARIKREEELDRLSPEVAEIVKEIDPADCDLPTSTRQLNYLAGVDDPHDQVEIASRVAAGEAKTVWDASKQLKEERGEVLPNAMQESMDAWARTTPDGEEEPLELMGITKAGPMEYVVKWSDGSSNRVTRKTLLNDHGFKKCKNCSGYGIVEGKGK